jgi:hypothetical protein
MDIIRLFENDREQVHSTIILAINDTFIDSFSITFQATWAGGTWNGIDIRKNGSELIYDDNVSEWFPSQGYTRVVHYIVHINLLAGEYITIRSKSGTNTVWMLGKQGLQNTLSNPLMLFPQSGARRSNLCVVSPQAINSILYYQHIREQWIRLAISNTGIPFLFNTFLQRSREWFFNVLKTAFLFDRQYQLSREWFRIINLNLDIPWLFPFMEWLPKGVISVASFDHVVRVPVYEDTGVLKGVLVVAGFDRTYYCFLVPIDHPRASPIRVVEDNRILALEM